MYRYYSISRPINPGSYPKNNLVDVVNFRQPKYIQKIDDTAYGYVEYSRRLLPKETMQYELVSEQIQEWVSITYVVVNGIVTKAQITETKCCENRPENISKQLHDKIFTIEWFVNASEAENRLREIGF